MITKSFNSTGLTPAAATAYTIPHGMAVTPKLTQFYLKCTSAEQGYSIGDNLIVSSCTMDGSTPRGFGSSFDATNIYVVFSTDASNILFVPNKATGAIAQITYGNWDFYVNAYA